MDRSTRTSSCRSTPSPEGPGSGPPAGEAGAGRSPGSAQNGRGGRSGRAARRNGKAEDIGSILARLMARRGLSRKSPYAPIRSLLRSMFGPSRAAALEVRGIVDGALVIGVTSAPLKHELESFYVAKILRGVQTDLARPDIRSIRFKLVPRESLDFPKSI